MTCKIKGDVIDGWKSGGVKAGPFRANALFWREETSPDYKGTDVLHLVQCCLDLVSVTSVVCSIHFSSNAVLLAMSSRDQEVLNSFWDDIASNHAFRRNGWTSLQVVCLLPAKHSR